MFSINAACVFSSYGIESRQYQLLISSDNKTLVGMNVLGRLLMELREELHAHDKQHFLKVSPPRIPTFTLYGQAIEEVTGFYKELNPNLSMQQSNMFAVELSPAFSIKTLPVPPVGLQAFNPPIQPEFYKPKVEHNFAPQFMLEITSDNNILSQPLIQPTNEPYRSLSLKTSRIHQLLARLKNTLQAALSLLDIWVGVAKQRAELLFKSL